MRGVADGALVLLGLMVSSWSAPARARGTCTIEGKAVMPFIVTVAQRYRKDAGLGTIVAIMLPYAVILQVTPIVAIAPLIIIWVHTPFLALLTCAWIVAFFPIVSNTAFITRRTR